MTQQDQAFIPNPCPFCGAPAFGPDTIEYSTRIKLDRTWHDVRVPRLQVERCEACHEVLFGTEADAQIDEALRRDAGLLLPSEIVRGRERLDGLSQRELADEIGVAPETLSRWNSGTVIQSRLADRMLRVYFAVPQARAFLRGLSAQAPQFRRVRIVEDQPFVAGSGFYFEPATTFKSRDIAPQSPPVAA